MSRKDIQTEFRIAATLGLIKHEDVNRYTLLTILESGIQAFHQGFHGEVLQRELDNVRKMNHEARERSLLLAESKINDLAAIRKMHKSMENALKAQGAVQETLTTSDFPLALANSRDYTRRDTYLPPESMILQFARRRTANDFKLMRGIRGDALDRLPKRPEGTNVEYAKFGSTADGYSIANYELAIPYTWESWMNDDIGEFQGGLAALGLAARRTRSYVVWEAIKAEVARQQLAGSNGGPDIERIRALKLAFANTQVTLSDGSTKTQSRRLSDIIVPVAWEDEASIALNSTQLIVNTGGTKAAPIGQYNPVKGAANLHVDTMMTEIFDDNPLDWIGIAAGSLPLEFATLKGYEGGPKTFTKMPDVVETDMEGSFDNKSIAVKMSDNVGAKVIEPKNIIRVQGQ